MEGLILLEGSSDGAWLSEGEPLSEGTLDGAALSEGMALTEGLLEGLEDGATVGAGVGMPSTLQMPLAIMLAGINCVGGGGWPVP